MTHSSSRGCPVCSQAISLARSCACKPFAGNIQSHLYKWFTYYRDIIKAKKVCRIFNKKEVWGEAFTAFNLSCSCFSSNQELVSRGPAGVRVHSGFDRVYFFVPSSRFLSNIWKSSQKRAVWDLYNGNGHAQNLKLSFTCPMGEQGAKSSLWVRNSVNSVTVQILHTRYRLLPNCFWQGSYSQSNFD